VNHPPLFKALTISGSDSSAADGIQADLKTFASLGVYGSSVVTAVTAQNTVEVTAIAEVPDEVLIAQIDTVIEDVGAHAAKVGMLSGKSIVENTADRLEAWGIPHLVLDPVMVSKSGAPLLQLTAMRALVNELIPLCTIITPSIAEAATLIKKEISTATDAEEAAKAIHEMGADIVVIKGGHVPGSAVDLVYADGQFTPIEGERTGTHATHGTGATFSAAITAFLAMGIDPMEAIRLAKRYIENALRHSLPIGEGYLPVNHFAPLSDEIASAIASATNVG